MMQPRSMRWNLFARELEDILAAHGYRLGHLTDRANIHPQKVARLKRSLREPKFHLLAPSEVEYIVLVFGLSEAEHLRIRAAVLATAIEEILMGRILNTDALLAAEQLLPILQTSLRTYGNIAAGMGAVKDGVPRRFKEEPLENEPESSADPVLEHALDMLDRAIIVLHLSHETSNLLEQQDLARQAHDGFIGVLAQLDTVVATVKQGQDWRIWYDEAERGLAMANQLINGISP